MPIVTANGLELAYESFGDPRDPAMLLISGLGTQMIRWSDGFCTALAARGYRVIRFDNRDAGLSTHLHDAPVPELQDVVSALMAARQPGIPYTLQAMAGDAVALLEALKISRAHVVGRSMGGMIAQVLASEHPGRVASLTSIMSGTGNPALPQAAPEVMALMSAPLPDPTTDPEGFLARRLAFAERIAGSGAPFDRAAQARLALEEARRAHDPAGTARQLAAMVVAGDRRARLARVVAPALVIHGTEDPLIPPACGEDTAASIPGAEYLPVPGMGHDLPEPFHAPVIAALDRTARRAGAR